MQSREQPPIIFWCPQIEHFELAINIHMSIIKIVGTTENDSDDLLMLTICFKIKCCMTKCWFILIDTVFYQKVMSFENVLILPRMETFPSPWAFNNSSSSLLHKSIPFINTEQNVLSVTHYYWHLAEEVLDITDMHMFFFHNHSFSSSLIQLVFHWNIKH